MKRYLVLLVVLALSFPCLVVADDHVVSLPLVANGDINPIYALAPAKPFWRRGAATEMAGRVSGVAIVTGLQTIVIRYYKNPYNYDVEWHLVVRHTAALVSYGQLLRFGTFIFEGETALILIVPTNHMLIGCKGADTLVACSSNGLVHSLGIFPLPCKDFWWPRYNEEFNLPEQIRQVRDWIESAEEN